MFNVIKSKTDFTINFYGTFDIFFYEKISSKLFSWKQWFNHLVFGKQKMKFLCKPEFNADESLNYSELM